MSTTHQRWLELNLYLDRHRQSQPVIVDFSVEARGLNQTTPDFRHDRQRWRDLDRPRREEENTEENKDDEEDDEREDKNDEDDDQDDDEEQLEEEEEEEEEEEDKNAGTVYNTSNRAKKQIYNRQKMQRRQAARKQRVPVQQAASRRNTPRDITAMDRGKWTQFRKRKLDVVRRIGCSDKQLEKLHIKGGKS
ncbi:MAG: hypothetical protein Q9176_004787 [Flavoplaca citrina]